MANEVVNAVELKILEVKKAEILFNEVELQKYLADILKEFEGLVFTDETVKDCKARVTELNKMVTQVENFRKKHKKEMLEPIDEFELKIKSLVEQIIKVQMPLKLQSENFEIKRKEDRKNEVMGFIVEVLYIVNLDERWASQLVLRDEWLNVSLSTPKCKKAIMEEAQKLLGTQKNYYDKKEMVDAKCELYSTRFGLSVALVPDNFYYMLDSKTAAEIDEKILDVVEKTKEKEKEAIAKIEREAENKANIEAKRVAQIEIDRVKAESVAQVAEITEVMAQVVEQVQSYVPVEATVGEKIGSLSLRLSGQESNLMP